MPRRKDQTFKRILVIILLILINGCGSDDDNSAPTTSFEFEDGFENATEPADLIVGDGSRWTNIQMVNPNNGTNEITIGTDIANTGDNALRILAKPSDDILSKMDIEKGGLSAPAGSTVTIEADFYINSTENLRDLLLIDLECCSCWDPNVPDNQCPGVRLMLAGENEYLSIERGKIIGTTISQSNFPFPKQQWVNVIWEMTLSPESDGMNKLMINGQEVISTSGMNMPNPEMFRSVFADNGIDFELQQPLFYERVQVGATANPTDHEITLYVDNFKLTIR